MIAPTSTITRLGLLQRIRRWVAKTPNREFHRYRPGTANFRRYGQTAVFAQGVMLAHGTLEKAARAVDLLKDNELTVDEEVKQLLLDLAGAGSPKPGTKAFEKWCVKHPEFNGRIAAVLRGQAVDEAGELTAVPVGAMHSNVHTERHAWRPAGRKEVQRP